jgi:sn-glycerol 3-phosphate transport system ATP-binding protein
MSRSVQGHHLDIPMASSCVLVGPSGCGKSTLLRMIAGLETHHRAAPSRSAARGERRLEPAERDIAMVFQNYALYPHMSVRENMAYGLKNRGTPKPRSSPRRGSRAHARDRACCSSASPASFRAASASASRWAGPSCASRPCSCSTSRSVNLDAKLRVQMRVEIKPPAAPAGTTSVYVTHDQLEAMTLADRLVVMNGGRIEQIGTPLEVYERPATLFVAGFIGSPPMNGRSSHEIGEKLAVATSKLHWFDAAGKRIGD